MNKRVICDTNIWYYFASGRFSLTDFGNLHFVATWLNITELASARLNENRKDDFKIIEDACKFIIKHDFEIIELDYYEYQADKIVEDKINFHKRNYKELLKTIPKFNGDLSSKTVKDYLNYFDRYKSEFKSNLDNYISQQRNLYEGKTKKEKTNYKSGKTQKKLISNQQIGFYLELSNYLFNEYKIGLDFKSREFPTVNLSEEEIGKTEPFNFYLHSRQAYFKELTINFKKSISKNDSGDLRNLIYVGENDYYFTMDKEWKKIIIAAGFRKKLI